MLTLMNPNVLEHFHAERQRRLRPTPRTGETPATAPAAIRVRVGRALIGAGTAISGERFEPAARPSTKPQPRAA
jgi:hypothetical protein